MSEHPFAHLVNRDEECARLRASLLRTLAEYDKIHGPTHGGKVTSTKRAEKVRLHLITTYALALNDALGEV